MSWNRVLPRAMTCELLMHSGKVKMDNWCWCERFKIEWLLQGTWMWRFDKGEDGGHQTDGLRIWEVGHGRLNYRRQGRTVNEEWAHHWRPERTRDLGLHMNTYNWTWRNADLGHTIEIQGEQEQEIKGKEESITYEHDYDWRWDIKGYKGIVEVRLGDEKRWSYWFVRMNDETMEKTTPHWRCWLKRREDRWNSRRKRWNIDGTILNKEADRKKLTDEWLQIHSRELLVL